MDCLMHNDFDTFFRQLLGTLAYLSGEVKFINNTGGEHSAMHLTSFAQLVHTKELSMLFKGNSGRLL